jgi:hypothetical protein
LRIRVLATIIAMKRQKKAQVRIAKNGFATPQVQLQAAGATFRHFDRPRMIGQG